MSLNSNEPFAIISFDFSREFDSVPHHKFLQQLSPYYLFGKMMAWINTVLSDQSQSFNVEASSTSKPMTSGVVQDSVLGTLLFTVSLYIDSLLNSIDIIYLEIEMPLSFKKCLVIHYGLHNPYHNYKFGNYTLRNKNRFVDLVNVMSYEGGEFCEHIASTIQKVCGSPDYVLKD